MSSSQCYVGTLCGMVLCIDRIDHTDKVIGRIYHGYRLDAMEFSGMTEAILYMEQFYDEMKYPFSGTKSRCFGETKEPVVVPYKQTDSFKTERAVSDEELLDHRGKRETFIIRVEQRQHSSWQGRVTWIEKGETVTFRSVLELLKLMNQALEQDKKKESVDSELLDESQNKMEAV